MINKFLKNKNAGRQILSLSKGFSLVETLVAISIFSMSILALIAIFSQGIANITYAKQKMIATYLNQEGIEYIRNMRDDYILYPTNGTWATFNAKMASCSSASPCGFDSSKLFSDANFIFPCPSDSACKLYVNNGAYNSNVSSADSGFVRKIWMTTVSANEVKIFSSISWSQGSGNYNIVFSENLFNWI